MESQPQNIEFRINPENFHPGFYHQQGFFFTFFESQFTSNEHSKQIFDEK